MSEQEAIDKLNALNEGDAEQIHKDADAILLKFLEANGWPKIAQAWRDADERCGGFWYA